MTHMHRRARSLVDGACHDSVSNISQCHVPRLVRQQMNPSSALAIARHGHLCSWPFSFAHQISLVYHSMGSRLGFLAQLSSRGLRVWYAVGLMIAGSSGKLLVTGSSRRSLPALSVDAANNRNPTLGMWGSLGVTHTGRVASTLLKQLRGRKLRCATRMCAGTNCVALSCMWAWRRWLVACGMIEL